jgi:hypothetical protein
MIRGASLDGGNQFRGKINLVEQQKRAQAIGKSLRFVVIPDGNRHNVCANVVVSATS